MTPQYERTLAGMDSLDRSRKARVAEDAEARLVMRDVARDLAPQCPELLLRWRQWRDSDETEKAEFLGNKRKNLREGLDFSDR